MKDLVCSICNATLASKIKDEMIQLMNQDTVTGKEN